MRSLFKRFSGLIFALLLCGAAIAAQTGFTVGARRKALSELLAEQWEYRLRTSPLFASFLGDKRWNDKLDDFSQEAIDKDLLETQKFLARFEAIDTSGFPDQEILDKRLMIRDLKIQLEGAKFKDWEMPVNQQSGIQLELPQLALILSFQSVKDYDDYITRLKAMPLLLDQTMIQMRKGVADNLMPPAFLLEKVWEQTNGIATLPAADSPFAQPFKKFPDSISKEEEKRLKDQGLAAIATVVQPAYARFAKFVH